MFGRRHVEPQKHFEPFAAQRARMIETQLRRRGIHSPAVLAAMETIPRHPFVTPEFEHRAYEDEALPSQQGQTISQPYMVAAMTQELALKPGQRVLEIGTGTGYQTAILAQIIGPEGKVFSIERIPALAETARAHLDQLQLFNVEIIVSDGSLGWPSSDLRFDRILVTAGAPQIPQPLLDQLEDGGILVAPIGDEESQMLTRVMRHGERFDAMPLFACRFVPLVGAHGWEAEAG